MDRVHPPAVASPLSPGQIPVLGAGDGTGISGERGEAGAGRGLGPALSGPVRTRTAREAEGRAGGRWHALRKLNRIPTGAGDGPAGDVPRGADRGLPTTVTGHCPQARVGVGPVRQGKRIN